MCHINTYYKISRKKIQHILVKFDIIFMFDSIDMSFNCFTTTLITHYTVKYILLLELISKLPYMLLGRLLTQ